MPITRKCPRNWETQYIAPCLWGYDVKKTCFGPSHSRILRNCTAENVVYTSTKDHFNYCATKSAGSMPTVPISEGQSHFFKGCPSGFLLLSLKRMLAIMTIYYGNVLTLYGNAPIFDPQIPLFFYRCVPTFGFGRLATMPSANLIVQDHLDSCRVEGGSH